MKKWIICISVLVFITGFPVYNTGAGPFDWLRSPPITRPMPMPSPSITGINPMRQSAGREIIIVGNNFGTSPGNVIFRRGDSEIGAVSLGRWDQNRIVATIPALESGMYDVIVRSTGGLESDPGVIEVAATATIVTGVPTEGPECVTLRDDIRRTYTYEGKIKSYRMEGGVAFFLGGACRFDFEKCQIQGEIPSVLTAEETSITGYDDPEYDTIKYLYMMNYCEIVRDAYLSGKNIKVRANTMSTEGNPPKFIMKQITAIEIISGP